MEDKELAASVSKGGEVRIATVFQRPISWHGPSGDPNKASGFSISCKVHAPIEEYFRSVGTGEQVQVAAMGRHWQALDGRPLMAYVTPTIEPIMMESGAWATVERLGYPLIEGDQRQGQREIVNISFLRLVGISEGAGISFGIKGIYSLDTLKRIKDQVSLAQKRFYIAYMRPVDLTVTISTGEMQL